MMISSQTLLVLLLHLILTFPVTAGTLTGTVVARGKEGADPGSTGGAYDSRKFKFAERVDYDQMRDFVVYIEGITATNVALGDKPLKVLTVRKVSQKGAMFSPRILPVLVGTTVEWPNMDEIFHNVFSISDAKPFDLGLYRHPEVKRVTFDKPGRVDIFCSIHKTMNCIVLVLESPYFASTDNQGRFTITGVPPGSYKLKAWHERLPSQTKQITVPETGDVRVDFVLGINNLPKY